MNAQTNPLTASITEANRMLEQLNGEAFTFQTFGEGDQKRQHTKVLHGTLEANYNTLELLNRQGAGIFITVNETDLQGRKAENIKRIRALWVDFDKADAGRVESLKGLPISPNLIVESSKDKHHAYWVFNEGEIPPEQFTQLQKRLIQYFADDGADKAVHDLPRVMRLAGFYHRKNEPFMTRIMHTDAWYSADEVITWVQSLPVVEDKKDIKKPLESGRSQAAANTSTSISSGYTKVKAQAQGHWRVIFSKLGINLPTDVHIHTPCPMCGGEDRFRFDDTDGHGTWICSQGTGDTKAGDGFNLLEHGGDTAASALLKVKRALENLGLVKIEWGEMQPISCDLLPVMPLKREMLPVELSDYIFDAAHRADNSPPDAVAVAVMTTLGTVIGAKVGVRPKQKDDSWEIVPNQWGGIIAPPSSKKTPLLSAGLTFVKELEAMEKLQVSKEQDEQKKAKKRLEILLRKNKKQTDNINSQHAKVTDDDSQADEKKRQYDAEIERLINEELKLESEIEKLVEPKAKRYFSNDTTPEKLGELLQDNPDGMLVNRDELIGLLQSLEKGGEDTGRSFYLEGFNGTSGYSQDRIGRGSIVIPNHCISVLGGIQPEKLIAYIQSQISGGQNDGLLQRFQLMVYPDPCPWINVDQYSNREAKKVLSGIYKTLGSLSEQQLKTFGAIKTEFDKRPYFRLSEDAYATFTAWRNHLNTHVKMNEPETIIIEHLGKFESLIAKIALTFHLIECITLGVKGAISSRVMKMALAWYPYLESHARRIYGTVLNAHAMRAGNLLDKLKKLNGGSEWAIKGFTTRDVIRKSWKGLNEEKYIAHALEVLEQAHYIKVEKVETTAQGGRPTIRYKINPQLFKN